MANEKILVVDDEVHIVELLKYNLKLEGYKVIIARNGKEAIKFATDEKPNLILLDVMLPEIDGFEVCKHLTKSKDTVTNSL